MESNCIMGKQEIIDEIVRTKEHLVQLEQQLAEAELERWKPKDSETYWYVNSRCESACAHFCSTYKVDTDRYQNFNCFQSHEQAQAEAEKIFVRRKLEDIARRLNKGQKIDWNNHKPYKYSICFNFDKNEIDYLYCSSQKEQGVDYLTCNRSCTFKESKAFQLFDIVSLLDNMKMNVELDDKYNEGIVKSIDLMRVTPENTIDLLLAKLLKQQPNLKSVLLTDAENEFVTREFDEFCRRAKEKRNESD